MRFVFSARTEMLACVYDTITELVAYDSSGKVQYSAYRAYRLAQSRW